MMKETEGISGQIKQLEVADNYKSVVIIRIDAYIRVCVCVCMYVCIYVCVYIYMYIYIYIYISTPTHIHKHNEILTF